MLIFCIPTSRISYLLYRYRVTAMSCTPKSSMASSRTPLQVTTPRFGFLGSHVALAATFLLNFGLVFLPNSLGSPEF